MQFKIYHSALMTHQAAYGGYIYTSILLPFWLLCA